MISPILIPEKFYEFMIKTVLFAALSFLTTFTGFAQKPDDVVASAGNKIITLKEFKSRYELMPRMSEYSFNTDSLKKEFLYSLLGEKLWGMEAEARGYDTLGYFRNSFSHLEKLYLKDALYEQEVGSKIKISPDEIEKGVNRSRYTIKTGIFSTADSAAAFQLYKGFIEGFPIDSLDLPEMDITYGSMNDTAIEDTIYSISPGNYSTPVKYLDGWFIFHVKDRIFNSKEDNEKILSRVKQNLKERKARETGIRFLSSFLKDVKANTDTVLFRDLAKKISDELRNKTPDEYEKNEQKLFLSDQSVINIQSGYSKENLHSLFIRIENKVVTLYEFLSFLRFDILSVRSPHINNVMQALKNKTDFFIEQEFLSEEARRRNLHLTDEYQEEIRLWRENYLAKMLRTDFLRGMSVSNEEVYEFYLELSNRVDSAAQINILEILTDDLDVVETVLNELNNGTDFREIARLYTQREWTKNKGGEFGLFPVTLFKDISEKAINMEIGDVFGPLKLEEGYSVFKLIDKKEAVKSYREDYDAVKDQLRNDLLVKKFQNSIEDETVRLAEKYQVRVNEDLLNKIPVSEINMFTYRYMGFGGRISAVPYTTPWHEWRKKTDIKEL
jgi:parvulin-like peptidyl-prolyl isomerase